MKVNYFKDSYINKILRPKLDSDYHGFYDKERENLQNRILRKIYIRYTKGRDNIEAGKTPWMIMTAGPLGCGKTQTIQYLLSQGFLAIYSPVIIDLDQIRELLPESSTYKATCPEDYGEKTQLESGCIAELLVHLCLRKGRNIIFDGSMTNKSWQKQYLQSLKREYLHLRVLLIHVSASEETIRRRVVERNFSNIRIVPKHVMESSIQRLNDWRAFRDMEQIVDIFLSLTNNEDDQSPVIIYPWFLKFEHLRDVMSDSKETLERTIPLFSQYDEPSDYLHQASGKTSCDVSPQITADHNEVQIIDTDYASAKKPDSAVSSSCCSTSSTATLSFSEISNEEKFLVTTPDQSPRNQDRKKRTITADSSPSICNVCRLEKLPCPIK